MQIFQAVVLLVVAGSAIWVVADAGRRDFSRSSLASKTWQWVVGTLLWIVVLPVYLAKRAHAPVKPQPGIHAG